MAMLTDKPLLDYINTVDWENEEDWFGDCLYVKEYLLEMYNGVSKETEEDYLGEIIAKIYHQEGVLPVLKKIIYPLIHLLSADRIHHKTEVIELIIDIQEKF